MHGFDEASRFKNKFEIVVIGGSAGSFPVVNRMLEKINPAFKLPIAMCLHRLKDKREGFKEALEIKSVLPVVEPNDKDFIEPGKVFIAPANYHLLIENKERFALAVTELIQYSRPSIDVLFDSCADVFGHTALSIVLSGANKDGAFGVKRIKKKGGFVIVQDPQECSMTTMPEAAINAVEPDMILPSMKIVEFLNRL
ncbi:MAG: chemotaxis protein CheB [Bacteroidia bacterium]|nr:chemotaxis protein CheB [Bacteroidia bacterium]